MADRRSSRQRKQRGVEITGEVGQAEFVELKNVFPGFRDCVNKGPARGHIIVKSQDPRMEKILEASGVLREGEGSPVLKTGGRRGSQASSTAAWGYLENSEENLLPNPDQAK